MATQESKPTETSDSVHALEVQAERLDRSIATATKTFQKKILDLEVRRDNLKRDIVALKKQELAALEATLPETAK